MSVDVDIFEKELECDYKNEHYSVRDNGAVMRHSKAGGKIRKLDGIWVFGKPNSKNYLCFSSEQVHRIVATAFHGVAPTSQYIVDHIDTNRHNNRPENLRWLTKLENILNNPITRNKIIYLCGSIEAFLADPSILPANDGYPNFAWMRRVTKEEGQNCLERMKLWVKKDPVKVITQSTKPNIDDPFESEVIKQGEWLFKSLSTGKSESDSETSPPKQDKLSNCIKSLTSNAVQRIVFLNDKPNEFPCTPQSFDNDPLNAYMNNLKKGAEFFRNQNGAYVVVKSAYSNDRQKIYVMTKATYITLNSGERIPVQTVDEYDNNTLPHSLSTIEYEDGVFIHDRVTTGFWHDREYIEEVFNKIIHES